MASNNSLRPLLRRAAPRLSRHFFGCAQCSKRQTTLPTVDTSILPSTRQTPFLQAFRYQSTAAAPLARKSIIDRVKTPFEKVKSSLERVRHTANELSRNPRSLIPPPSAAEKGDYFPKTTRSIVAYWLLGSAASVFGLVVFGGLTRLTESGLSITEWRPVTGILPPLTVSEWDIAFLKYRKSPEFQKLNPNMNLEEFKKIFWMEYIHRLWGRVVGLSFLLPTTYFILRRRCSRPIARNLVLINGLIALQGFVGWWMVKSGLKEDLFAQNAQPRVSQYRLATHLALAFATFTAMSWNALQILRERHLLLHTQPNRALKFLARLRSPNLRPLRVSAALVTALVSTTVLSGALVAGLDAGLIYNEFPRMGAGLAPPRSELFSAFYSRTPPPHADLWWRNALENPALAQLDHRVLATTTFTAVNALYLYARFSPAVRAALSRGGRRALAGMCGVVWMQAALGLGTLLYMVPISLAALHQAGALALLGSVVVLGSRVWTPPRLARLVQTRATNVARTIERAKARARESDGIRKRPGVKREGGL